MPPRLRGIACHGALPLPLSFRGTIRQPAILSRSFSATTRDDTRQRRLMKFWLEGAGQCFKDPLPGSTNYLSAYDRQGNLRRALPDVPAGDKNDKTSSTGAAVESSPIIPPESFQDLLPYPLNNSFRSQEVTSEALRDDVWERVMKDGQSVKTVSAELGVEMNRVAAIVRLKEVEKEWLRKGKRLAKPYAKAVMAMLPQYRPVEERPKPFESINDLPVHAATKQQIFYPTSESRHFTRADAARVFDETLLPADDRVPHPELALLEKERIEGYTYKERKERHEQRAEAAQAKKDAMDQRRKAKEASSLTVVDGKRWEFRFRDISVDAVGADGRGQFGTGWRYGVPHMDRRRAEVKIPTRVA